MIQYWQTLDDSGKCRYDVWERERDYLHLSVAAEFDPICSNNTTIIHVTRFWN